MSTELILHETEEPNSLIRSLDEQWAAAERNAPLRLVVYCSEVRKRSPGRWEDAWPDALFLRTDGASLDGSEIDAAIDHAIESCDVGEIALIADGDCVHRVCEEPIPMEPQTIIDRIARGVRSHRAGLDATKAHVRESVQSMSGRVAGRARVVALLEAGEGGGVMYYDQAKDTFLAIE